MIFAGLVGAIAWNLITWYFGLPSSSSHALIGGIVGAAFAAVGPRRDRSARASLGKVLIPAVIAPIARLHRRRDRDRRRLPDLRPLSGPAR